MEGKLYIPILNQPNNTFRRPLREGLRKRLQKKKEKKKGECQGPGLISKYSKHLNILDGEKL